MRQWTSPLPLGKTWERTVLTLGRIRVSAQCLLARQCRHGGSHTGQRELPYRCPRGGYEYRSGAASCACRWPLRQPVYSDDHHLGGSSADISPLIWGCWRKRDRVSFPEDIDLVPQRQGTSPSTMRANFSVLGAGGIFPTPSSWLHGDHDGLQLSRLIQGGECLDRDRRPGAGELRTNAGSHQPHGADLWLREKLSKADHEGHSNALQRPNGRRDLAVFHLGNKTGRKASLGSEGRVPSANG